MTSFSNLTNFVTIDSRVILTTYEQSRLQGIQKQTYKLCSKYIYIYIKNLESLGTIFELGLVPADEDIGDNVLDKLPNP